MKQDKFTADNIGKHFYVSDIKGYWMIGFLQGPMEERESDDIQYRWKATFIAKRDTFLYEDSCWCYVDKATGDQRGYREATEEEIDWTETQKTAFDNVCNLIENENSDYLEGLNPKEVKAFISQF